MGRGKSADASGFWRRWDDLGIKDLTLTSASKEAGNPIASSTISSYRTERRYPRANEAVLMARVGHTTVEYLETGRAPTMISQDEFALLEKARRWRGLLELMDSLDPAFAESVSAMIRTAAHVKVNSPGETEELPRAAEG